ncbi:MAG: histidine kinase dimerization/phospho-acceptor domain-containing protein, partial [Planctomycetota bacterium]
MKLKQDILVGQTCGTPDEEASGPPSRVEDSCVCPAKSAAHAPVLLKRAGPVESPRWRLRQASRWLMPLVVLCAFAVLFVGWEVVERHLLPFISIGVQHALLTVRAAVATALCCVIVYLMMQRQQQRLSATAEQLTRLLASYKANPSVPERFENPHLVHCREVLNCQRMDCPMYSAPGERCWQVMALQGVAPDQRDPPIALEQCQKCLVYRTSCPDTLTELGESFNNLMFLLETEAGRVGQMRAQMVEKQKMVAIGQIAAGIAHEVGNPLSSISSVVQMLKRRGGDKAALEQLDLIETHIQRISSTVRQLVTLARPGAEQWERVDLGNTLSEAVGLIAFDRRARGVDIQYEPPWSLPATYALRGQLQQVFINL